MIKFMLPLSLFSLFTIVLLLISDVTRSSQSTDVPSKLFAISMPHDHPPLATDGWNNIPEIGMNIVMDPMTQGWNLQLETQHFRFTPEDVNRPSRHNTGHAHLYVDGVKTARLYSTWIYLNKLPTGTHTLRITLNSNMHEELTLNGQAISIQQTIRQN